MLFSKKLQTCSPSGVTTNTFDCPPITKWNLARFAECLIPLIDKNEDNAIKLATDLIDNFQNIYEDKWLNMMRDKLGLFGEDKNDKKLINNLLDWMKKMFLIMNIYILELTV